ncbi:MULTISPECIES: hypothetical protein [unclassified Streptomyces]|uniref:hypothetical protein n=1 Tax=unclassified Streptomyces TaxID=2593676 RepID=UPI000374826D|nr:MULTISPECIES: hypothetical protein [unclassified Streptomyces]MYT31741.1 hypothetical protein [Streptomyces sp. SID8354]
MSEQTSAPTDEQTNENEQPQDESRSSEPQAGASEGDLPEWARKELTKVRGEAASYRTRLRDAEAKLSEAKSPEEFEAALNELQAKNAELEHSLTASSVARKHNLPDELAARLRGSTVEELEADARALAVLLAPKTPESLGGGLSPSDDDDGEMDPRKLARRFRRF